MKLPPIVDRALGGIVILCAVGLIATQGWIQLTFGWLLVIVSIIRLVFS